MAQGEELMNESNNHFNEIIRICREAEQVLLIAMPWWADDEAGKQIRQEVEVLAMRGVDVKVHIRPDASNQRTIHALKTSGVSIKLMPQLHGKAVCSEKEHALITLNFFNKDVIKNTNYARFSKDQSEIEQFTKEFLREEASTSRNLEGPELYTDKKDLIEELSIQKAIPFSRLNPLQSLCTRHALYGKENLLIIAPTGSGKTLVGILGLLSAAICQDAKAVWLVPSRALAKEITAKIKKLDHPNIKPLPLLGGEDAHNELLSERNIWICTTEKFESILRRKSALKVTNQIYTIVIDEIHLLADKSRGPLLESIIARIKDSAPFPRVIGLSATLENDEEFAGWFNARVLKSTWKPSTLNTEVAHYAADAREDFWIREERREKSLIQKLDQINQSPEKKGATLIFCRSKNKCFKQAIALLSHLTGDTKILGESNTKQPPNEEESELLNKNRIGIYYSGYFKSSESLRMFDEGDIEFLFATTGLAAGVNTNARAVIISETILGLDTPLDINTANQMLGRAGRGEGVDGWGIIVCPEYEKEKWVQSVDKSSKVKSAISDSLIEVILAEISLTNIKSRDEAKHWYLRTFQAFCNQENQSATNKIDKAISFLLKEGLALTGEDGGLKISKFGSACIRLMTDIESSIQLIRSLPLIAPTENVEWNEMQLVHAVSKVLRTENFTHLLENDSFKLLATECIEKYKLQTKGETPRELLNLITLDLLLYNKEKIRSLSSELSVLKNKCLFFVPENAPRYFALINQTGANASSPWITMCAHDLSQRVKWHNLNPNPNRGASRILCFIESLIDPRAPRDVLQKAWEGTQNKEIWAPHLIPTSAKKFSFCSSEKKCQNALSNIFDPKNILIDYIDDNDSFRISNLPPGSLETFAKIESSLGSTKKTTDKATTLEIPLPVASKEKETYSILVYSSTHNDKILFSSQQIVCKELGEGQEEQVLNLFKTLSLSLPEVSIARKQRGIRNFLREKLLGPIPHTDEFAEAIAKKEYLAEISAICRLTGDTDAMTAWRINDLINQVIKLESSLEDEPFNFQATTNTIRRQVGTILDRELAKATLGVNCGLEMGLAYNSNGGSIYALFKEEKGWGTFHNIPSHQSHHLKGIFPQKISGGIMKLVRPKNNTEKVTPCYEWVNEFSCLP